MLEFLTKVLAGVGLGTLVLLLWTILFELPKVQRENERMTEHIRRTREETERLRREHAEYMRRG
jgi:hypothetical protein